jgi:hypothetical protein
MRIDNGNNAGIRRTAGSPGAGAASRSADAEEAVSSAAPPYIPDPELAHLAELVLQIPAVRPDAIQAAAARLADGSYLSQNAARQTAAALMGGTP